jgi:hypothetical protein
MPGLVKSKPGMGRLDTWWVIPMDMKTAENKASTCNVMYCRQRPHLCIFWWLNLEILFDPFHRIFSFTGGQRCIQFLMGLILHIKGRGGGRGLYR